VEFLESTVSIDLLESESYPTAYGSRRAAVGDQFLTAETRVLNLGGSRCGAGGTNIDGSLVRLYVDDVPRAPIAWVNTTIAINEAKRPHLALQLPGRRRPAPDPLRVRGSRASLGERGSLGCRGSLTGVVSSGAELLES
jgi:hypothetical protein